VCKKLIINSQPFGKNVRKLQGVFFWLTLYVSENYAADWYEWYPAAQTITCVQGVELRRCDDLYYQIFFFDIYAIEEECINCCIFVISHHNMSTLSVIIRLRLIWSRQLTVWQVPTRSRQERSSRVRHQTTAASAPSHRTVQMTTSSATKPTGLYTHQHTCVKKGKRTSNWYSAPSRHGHLKGVQVYGAHQAASHVPALYLLSYSRYSFTDPKRMSVE